MAQHMGIVQISEFNDLLVDSGLNFAPIFYDMADNNPNFETEYPILSKIDEYGKTIFNQLQIPGLLEELKVLSVNLTSKDISPSIDELVSFIDSHKGTHTYIKFIGD